MTQNLIEKYDLGKYIGTLECKDIIAPEQREELFKNALGIEKMALAQAFYQTLDIGFLRMKGEQTFNAPYFYYGYKNIDNQTVDYSNNDQNVIFTFKTPLFAVYDTSGAEASISLTFSNPNIDSYKKAPVVAHSIRSSSTMPLPILQELSAAFTTNLSIRGSFDKSTNVTIRSIFSGIVPTNIKKEINIAQRIFGAQVYLVAPAHWTMSSVNVRSTSDPLVIGVLKDKPFLVDSFDCTPIEEYVKQKYVR